MTNNGKVLYLVPQQGFKTGINKDAMILLVKFDVSKTQSNWLNYYAVARLAAVVIIMKKISGKTNP